MMQGSRYCALYGLSAREAGAKLTDLTTFELTVAAII